MQIFQEQLQSQQINLTQSPDIVQELLAKTYEFTDERMKTSGVPAHHGCTAVTCIITGQGESRQLFCANVGDTRAILWYIASANIHHH